MLVRLYSACMGVGALCGVFSASAASPWVDSYYPYRVEVAVEIPAAGEYSLALTAETITAWVNEKATLSYSSKYFAYDKVKLVELKRWPTRRTGGEGGGFRVKVGQELLVNGGFEQREGGLPVGWEASHGALKLQPVSYDGSWCMAASSSEPNGCSQVVRVKKNTFYRFSAWAKGASPALYYSQKGASWWSLDGHTYVDPYSEPEQWRQVEYSFNTGDMSNWTTDTIVIRAAREAGSACDALSLRECEVGFVLRAEAPGRRRYMLYYSPVEGVTPTAPNRIVASLPPPTLAVTRVGETEWLAAGVAYRLPGCELGDLWYAATTIKVPERAEPPRSSASTVKVSCARHEAEAIQLVFRPKVSGRIERVRGMLRGPAGFTLSDRHFDIRRAQFIPILRSSEPGNYAEKNHRFTGRLPDPLTAFSAVSFKQGDPNILIWVDIAVPREAPAGRYVGEIVLTSSAGEIVVPVELTVWSFTLPDVPTFRSSFQMSRYANERVFAYHKAVTDPDKFEISRAYVAEMARYKMGDTTPNVPYLFLHGDPAQPFAMYDAFIPWALEELQLTAYRIDHVSALGAVSPEEARRAAVEKEPLAEHLEEKGWLDRAFILIDEPEVAEFAGVRRWIGAFREQPHAKNIKMLAATYRSGIWTSALKDDLDIICVQNHEVSSQDAFSRTGMEKLPAGKELWTYWTNTAHEYIDAPAINQRLGPAKNWWLGSRGVLCCGMMIWWKESDDFIMHNPWEDPWTPWGNGALAYFYPPDPRGIDLDTKTLRVVPSLRLVLFRDGVEDYEYATLLERLLASARSRDAKVKRAEAALSRYRRQFVSPVTWASGEAYWNDVRSAMAEAIEDLTCAQRGTAL